MQAILFIGGQASGKSTFYLERFFRTHIRINLDMLRTRHREAQLLDCCVRTGQPFVVDNTNPTPADRARYIEPARTAGFTMTGYYFVAEIVDALVRNAARAGRERIPDAGLRNTYARMQVPTFEEGFDTLYRVRLDSPHGFIVEEWPYAI